MAPSTSTTYRICSHAGSGKYLNVYGNDQVSANRNVCLWTLDTSAQAQKWNVMLVSTGVYKITTAIDSSYALNYYWTNGLGNPGNCDIYPHAGNADSTVEFIADANNPDVYEIRLTRSGTDLYLTADSSSTYITDNTNVSWKARNNDWSQKWKFEEVVGDFDDDSNYAIYPCKTMNITQKYDGGFSHINCSTGVPCDYPTDEACDDTGRSWMYCPCDEMEVIRLSGVGNSYTNTIWLKSTSKVKMPIGEDYLVMMVIHPEDDDLSSIQVGTIFHRGDAMFREGQDGYATGNHFHISLGTGNGITGTGWQENNLGEWVLTPIGETIKIEDGFYESE